MIITAMKLKGRQEKRREIMQTISGIADQARQCEGCIGVDCYQDIVDRNIFYYVQEFRTKKDADDHLNSKLFAALLGIKSILAEPPQIEHMYRSSE